MSVGDYCNREVVIAEPETGIVEAAQLMRHHHVGDLVVVSREEGGSRPVGIVTDRDLVVEVLAEVVPPHTIALKDIMSFDLATAQDTDGIWDTLDRMRRFGIRRMPVVDHGGELVGLLSVDDVLELIAEATGDLARIIKREVGRESRQRP